MNNPIITKYENSIVYRKDEHDYSYRFYPLLSEEVKVQNEKERELMNIDNYTEMIDNDELNTKIKQMDNDQKYLEMTHYYLCAHGNKDKTEFEEEYRKMNNEQLYKTLVSFRIVKKEKKEMKKQNNVQIKPRKEIEEENDNQSTPKIKISQKLHHIENLLTYRYLIFLIDN